VKKSETILIGGGVRGGKSGFAIKLALEIGENRLFLATGSAQDEEMRDRIENHRKERADNFRTVEEPLEITRVLREENKADVIVVDCLTFWVSNLCLKEFPDSEIRSRFADLGELIAEATYPIIFVTNEVGQGIVPDNALARKFRDHLGRLNQEVSSVVDRVYWSVMGIHLCLKPKLSIVDIK